MKKDELTTETTANAKPKLAEVALHDVEIMERFYDCETDDFCSEKVVPSNQVQVRGNLGTSQSD